MGLTITIGSLNKFTVIIIAIAVGIDLLINRKFKEFTKILVSVVSIMMIFNVTFNLYMYSSHLDRQTAKGENTPYNHWVMMGLKGDGVYNPEDYEFTRKYDYDENRNSKINKEIFDRIKNLGFCGIFDLAMIKSTETEHMVLKIFIIVILKPIQSYMIGFCPRGRIIKSMQHMQRQCILQY